MKVISFILIKFIRIYKYLISPLFGHSCRYLPTCSDYSIEALEKFGLLKGLLLILKRVFSCHPWSDGGFDPVRKEVKAKK